MFERILMICTGNICRSPMAEYLFRAGFPRCKVTSAGVGALVDHPIDATAASLLELRGIDAAAHRARQVSNAMLADSDLVLVMEARQLEWLNQRFPQHRGRLQLMTRWSDRSDVPDPYRRDQSAFVDVLERLDREVWNWRRVLDA